ncbi:MAG: hypothetical protein ACK5KT_05895 [Dysgonomonas sp.]
MFRHSGEQERKRPSGVRCMGLSPLQEQGIFGSNSKGCVASFGLPERLPCSFDNEKKIKRRKSLCFLNRRQHFHSEWSALSDTSDVAIRLVYCHSSFFFSYNLSFTKWNIGHLLRNPSLM